LTHRDSGSPLTRVTWTYLRLTLGNERVEFTFTDPPSVTFNQAPTFAKASYAFTIADNAAVAAAVGRVEAMDPDAGDTLTYAITAGNTGGAFAIDDSSGALTVAAALDHETTASYTLTVQASDGAGETATVDVIIAVTNAAG
jgi:VCBS repeat-containing protein